MDGTLPLRSKPASGPSARYAQLMDVADQMFHPRQIERLAPRQHDNGSRGESNGQYLNGEGLDSLDPLGATETIAYSFLAKGGKHSRPFITLAVYDAMTGGRGTQPGAEQHLAGLPDSVKRCALSIETFHKASLVHDDIEDDDEFRYGDQTLHRKYGTATAINVGDYLIGLGYRLVSREAGSLGSDVIGDILDHLADAHMKLSEGQGAELIWRDAQSKHLTPTDALRIYALKTAPAFEAALHAGLRMAGPAENYLEPIRQFARNLGIAFQIINDLNDWQGDDHNKLSAAGDVIGGRPTVLWAMALEGLPADRRAQMVAIAAQRPLTTEDVRQIRRLYEQAGVFETAERLVVKYQRRAEALADDIEPEALRALFHYLIGVVLERRALERVAPVVLRSVSHD